MIHQRLPTIGIVVISFFAQQIVCCQENPQTRGESRVEWSELKHGVKYGIDRLQKDKRINTRNALKRGTSYIRCKNSGCILKLRQVNPTFEIIVFPDTGVDSFDFESITAGGLIDLGYDIEAMESLLYGNGSMSKGMPFSLEFRFVARRLPEQLDNKEVGNPEPVHNKEVGDRAPTPPKKE